MDKRDIVARAIINGMVETRGQDAAIAIPLIADDVLAALASKCPDDGYARATADIVAWLRNEAATGPFCATPLNDTANAIERGDFRKVTA